jgi:hypothetical protein
VPKLNVLFAYLHIDVVLMLVVEQMIPFPILKVTFIPFLMKQHVFPAAVRNILLPC